MNVFQENVAACATTADFYVNATRREYIQAALSWLVVSGDRQAAQDIMADCLRVQARVSGIRLEGP